MSFNLQNITRKNIWDLSPYSSARDEFTGKAKIYLDANENPYDNGLNRYPDPYQFLLKSKNYFITSLSKKYCTIASFIKTDCSPAFKGGKASLTL